MSQLAAGKDTVCYCGRCKLSLSHTIVSMIGDKVSKVQCRTCGSTHGMKSAPGTAVRKKAGTTRKRKPSVPVSQLWSEALQNSTKRAKAYSIRVKFEKNDIIDHPKFGQGIVQEFLGGGKIEVMFQYDVKVLVHDKG